MISFNRKQYPNGLTLLHHADQTTPFAVVNILYKVGARNEDPHRTGFAHLFEHLMFEGTKGVPSFDEPLQRAGGINNAFTNNDYTNYYIKIPRENAELALALESDRMQNLDINGDKLSTQKKVVIEEFKENYTNKPYGDVWHTLRQMVYREHPYKWPTIGKDFTHIQDASLDEVKAFYHKYYLPSNAIICIAGNMSFEESCELVDNYFGRKEGPFITDVSFFEPLQSEAVTQTVERDVPLDAIYIAFKVSGRKEDDYYTADMLSDILAGSRSSRLIQRLVKKKKLFIQIDAYISGSVDTGLFVFDGKLAEGVDIKEAEAAIWEEIESLQQEEVDAREMEKVKNKLLTSMNFSENSLLSRAISLCYHEMLGDAAAVNEEESRYEQVDGARIKAFVNRYLNRAQSTTLKYLKRRS